MKEMPPDAPLTNAPEARTETGVLKDQQTPPTPPPETKPPTTEASPPEQPKSPVETKSTTPPSKPPEEGKTLLSDDKKDEKPAGAPEKYEAFKVPEGFEMSEEVTKEVTGLFKELNLSQEAGQKLVDYYTKQTQEAVEAPFKVWQETQEKWVNEFKADPEIGNKLPEVKATIGRALDSLGNPKLASDFKAAMDITGVGNHPAFIKTFYKMAQMLTEGSHVQGNSPSKFGQTKPGEGPPDAAHAMYPNLP